MPNKTIYINPENEEAWNSLQNKSGTVNSWLTTNSMVSMTAGKLEPLVVEAPGIRYANGLCKIHGLPLDDRGRCLQKGCKYA